MGFKTVYLTGAPAAGKSSVTRKLTSLIPELDIWEYGGRLTAYVSERASKSTSQEHIRERSSRLITIDDIHEVDKLLLDWVSLNRIAKNLIIDSHAVTKEHYGYRVTAFSTEKIAELNPDEIWVLYTAPEVTAQRIATDAAGRPKITLEEARLHTYLQGSLAISYGISIGAPVYFFDSDKAIDELALNLAARLK